MSCSLQKIIGSWLLWFKHSKKFASLFKLESYYKSIVWNSFRYLKNRTLQKNIMVNERQPFFLQCVLNKRLIGKYTQLYETPCKKVKDTNIKIRTTFFIDYCVWILVPNSQQDMHSAFCSWLASPQTSPVFTALLLEPFMEPQMYMNLVFLIFLLVSLL